MIAVVGVDFKRLVSARAILIYFYYQIFICSLVAMKEISRPVLRPKFVKRRIISAQVAMGEGNELPADKS